MPGGEGQGGAGAQVQDDLALPLGMSFAAVLAQVRGAIHSVAFPISGAGGEWPTCVYVRILPFTASTELYVILLATMHRIGPQAQCQIPPPWINFVSFVVAKLQLFRAIVHQMSNVAAWGQRSGDRAIPVRRTLWGRQIVTFFFHFRGGHATFVHLVLQHLLSIPK
jgi:hypothetical protein